MARNRWPAFLPRHLAPRQPVTHSAGSFRLVGLCLAFYVQAIWGTPAVSLGSKPASIESSELTRRFPAWAY